MKVFEFSHVNFIRGKKKILKDINWAVKNKENWAILGLNGSGKTTMLQLLSGYIWPSSGQLDVLGERFGKTSIPELRKKIGWVSSALQYQLKNHEKAELIVLSGKFASIGIYQNTTPEDLDEAKKVLSECGGKKLIGKKYEVLSQGERQMVLIARALMAKPQLLILDEPCNGLDLFAKERLLKKIESIAKSPNSPTLLYVSHHTEEILPCFDHIILLRDGQIIEQGKTQDLLNKEVLNHFYTEPVQLVKMNDQRIAVYPASEEK